jgi:hypothetical protein
MMFPSSTSPAGRYERENRRLAVAGLVLMVSLSLAACAPWPWAEPASAPAKSSRVVERDLGVGAPDPAAPATR